MATSSSFFRLTLLLTAVAAAVGAVSTPAVHRQPLVLLAPQAADADYIHQVDSISTATFAAAATRGRPSAAPDNPLIEQETELDHLWAAGRVPAEFVPSHVALRTALDLLVTMNEGHDTDALHTEYLQAVADFTQDYQGALRTLGLPPAPGG